MSKKKQIIKNYFDDTQTESLPVTTTSNLEQKKYNHHKLFEAPSDNPTPQKDIVDQASSIFIETDKISIWEHKKDRDQTYDFTSAQIDELAKSIARQGQLQPILVRENSNKKNTYELIFGECRWRACKKLNIPVKADVDIISNNDAALKHITENYNRKDNSDYQLGMQLSHLIDNDIITQSDLTIKLGFSKQKLSKLLSFSKIPKSIIIAIQDMGKVSATTAEKIKQLSNKGDKYIESIIGLANEIRLGLIGHVKLGKKVEDSVTNQVKQKENSKQKVFGKDGRHFFTWRKDNNNLPSIHFPKEIARRIENNNDYALNEKIISIIKQEILTVPLEGHKKSPS